MFCRGSPLVFYVFLFKYLQLHLVLFLYCACIVLVLYLCCSCIVCLFPLFILVWVPPPVLTPILYCTCIVLVLLVLPLILTPSHLSNLSQPHLVLYLYCTCILLVLCLYCHSAAPFAFSCNALYTSMPLSVNRYF